MDSFIKICMSIVFTLIRCLFLPYVFVTRAKHRIKPPGIDLMETVEIGGVQQALYFRGENIENPAILFIHGGPGFPEMPVLHTFQYEWKNYSR